MDGGEESMAERALHGVNLTGWLDLEPWVTPTLFADSGALNEESLIGALGRDRYQELVREHRNTFIERSDFKRIAARGFNAVRLPVPWYVFGETGPHCGAHVGCIEHVDNAFTWAEDVGLKLVLVLSVSPGSPDFDRVSIADSTDFRVYRRALVRVVAALARRYELRAGFFGIEVLSQPVVQRRQWLRVTDGIQMPALRNYYRDAYAAVRDAAGGQPVVILPDAGMPGAWGAFMAQSRYENVWLDCHLTHHLDNVNITGPVGVRHLADSSRKALNVARKSGLQAMVGSWSGALPYADALMTPEGRIALERVYISEQIAAFSDCPAWFFQTWKTEARISGWDARVSLATFERRMLV